MQVVTLKYAIGRINNHKDTEVYTTIEASISDMCLLRLEDSQLMTTLLVLKPML